MEHLIQRQENHHNFTGLLCDMGIDDFFCEQKHRGCNFSSFQKLVNCNKVQLTSFIFTIQQNTKYFKYKDGYTGVTTKKMNYISTSSFSNKESLQVLRSKTHLLSTTLQRRVVLITRKYFLLYRT